MVADADADTAVEVFDIDGDVAVPVDEGVVEEYVEGLTDGAVAAQQGGVAEGVDRHGAVGVMECRFEESDVLVNESTEIHGLGVGFVSMPPGDGEKFGDAVEEAVCVSDCRMCFLASGVEVICVCDFVEADGERGERGSELV